MDHKVRLGVTGYGVPDGRSGVQAARWLLDEAQRHDWGVLGFFHQLLLDDRGKVDHGALEEVRAVADERDIVLEPSAGRLSDLVGPQSGEGRAALTAGVRAAKVLGGPFLRLTYGELQIRTSRYNPELPLVDHMKLVVANLKEAARIAEDEDVVFGVENHCDFTGREWRAMLEEAGSPRVRAALDTGNCFTVFAQPQDDIDALAPITVLFHLKDMKVVSHDDPGQVPFLPVGCVLGDGDVDIARAIRIAWSQGERGRDLPLVVETGWVRASPGEDPAEKRREVLRQSVGRLRQLVVADESLREHTTV